MNVTDNEQPEVLRITIPLPSPKLSPNARCHYQAKARAVKKYRMDCGLATRDAMNRSRIKSFPWNTAKATPVFFHRQRRNRDQDNATASLKAAFDALADAGVIANDAGLRQMPPVLQVDSDDPRVELIVERMN